MGIHSWSLLYYFLYLNQVPPLIFWMRCSFKSCNKKRSHSVVNLSVIGMQLNNAKLNNQSRTTEIGLPSVISAAGHVKIHISVWIAKSGTDFQIHSGQQGQCDTKCDQKPQALRPTCDFCLNGQIGFVTVAVAINKSYIIHHSETYVIIWAPSVTMEDEGTNNHGKKVKWLTWLVFGETPQFRQKACASERCWKEKGMWGRYGLHFKIYMSSSRIGGVILNSAWKCSLFTLNLAEKNWTNMVLKPVNL